MSIGQKVAIAGTTLQNNLNARGVACTFGKNSDNKKTITDMANLITSDNLKGANDAVLNIYANRPYLMDGETTDIIASLNDGLGNPLANKEITITADIEDEVMDNIFNNSNWSASVITSSGAYNGSSTYKYMTQEFTGLNNYTISFQINYPGSNGEFRFGDTTSGTASTYLRMKLETTTVTISKVVNSVETIVYTESFGSGTFPRWIAQEFTITRSGDTFTFFGQTITLSGLKNTIGLVGTMGFYLNDFTVASLYTGITNQTGQLILQGITIANDSSFTSSYNTISKSNNLKKSLFVDYGLVNNYNDSWSNWGSYLVNRTRLPTYTIITPQDSTVAAYQIKYINALSNVNAIEFDAKQVGGATSDILFQLRGTNQSVQRQLSVGSFNSSTDVWYHYIFDFNNSTITNTTLNRTLTFVPDNVISFFFSIPANSNHTIQYANFVIY